ncbi:sugar phosphate isomerase/epimerase family protein [Paenibacillus massiliensis]|uniref:sugar phosphate isomerase/epimerase family protein n=1 Tax=Paenibacillus massiliensis TaxID=225917 RepID=UPI000472726A|nr:sugar phosphate isomerase/epimerase [Paenibacillus massiliensis]
MTVGVLAHLFGTHSYRELAARVGGAGFTHIQLALWKAVNDVDFSKPGKFSPGLALSMADAFQKEGVRISILGCYLHFFQRDQEALRENIERCKELIRYAPMLGAPIVAFETGKPTAGDDRDEDWKVLKATVEELVEEAERWGVIVGIEAANDHLVGTAKELHQLLQEVPTSQIGVVIDPGNLLTADNMSRQDDVIREAFDLLGDRIVAGHAKDRILTDKTAGEQGIETVAAGLGSMNYELYLELLHQYKPEAYIIMEEANPGRMAASKAYIDEIRERVRLAAKA